ncbi:hypothetical protein P3W45_000820 [Vairimorpha bombi]
MKIFSFIVLGLCSTIDKGKDDKARAVVEGFGKINLRLTEIKEKEPNIFLAIKKKYDRVQKKDEYSSFSNEFTYCDEILINDEVVSNITNEIFKVHSKEMRVIDSKDEDALFTEEKNIFYEDGSLITINKDRFRSYREYLNICALSDDHSNEFDLSGEDFTKLTHFKEEKQELKISDTESENLKMLIAFIRDDDDDNHFEEA